MSTAAKQISRLSDFIIEEVSLVDRAANKRRFLTIKRDDTDGREHLATLEPDGRGGFRIVGEATDSDTDNGDTSMTINATNVTKGMEAVEQIFYKVGDAVDRLMRVASVCMQADSLKVDGPTVETIASEIDKVTAALNEVKRDLSTAKSLLKNAEDGDAEAAAAAEKTNGLDQTIASLEDMAAELKKNVAAKAAKDEAEVAKAGAKMSAGRLKRFQGALKTLLGVLREVGGDDKAVMAKGAAAAAPAPADQPNPAPAAAASDDDGKDEDELAALKKRDAEHAAELAKLRKENAVLKASPVPSQAIPVEGDPNPTADEDFDWPMDMNKPLGKDHVPAEKSFHG